MSRFTRLRPTADDGVALFAGVAALAGSFAAVGVTPSFVASPLERWLARQMPGIVVSAAIQSLGSLGQQLNLVTAAVVVVVVLGGVARLGLVVGDVLSNRVVPPVLAGTVVFAVVTLLTDSFTSSGGAALATALTLGAVTLSSVVPAREGTSDDRRRVLREVGRLGRRGRRLPP